MENEKTKILKELLTGMAEMFSDTLSENRFCLYLSVLRQYDIDTIRKASFKIISTRKYLKMPTIGEFLENIHGNIDDLAEVEAAKIMWAIERVGPYKSVVFDDPVTQAVIASYGGWPALVDEADKEHKKKWFRNDLVKIYKAFSNKEIKRYGVLKGLFSGQRKKDEIICIGNNNKALEIMHKQDGGLNLGNDLNSFKLTSEVLSL
ncbi:MAG: DUF6475 domain-containing protein [bacterium]